MKTRSLFLLLVLSVLASCGTLRRAGKDLAIGVASPAVIIYGASTDAATAAQETREGYGAGAWVEVASWPFYFLYHGVKHLFWCALHIVDLPLNLFYWPAELHPHGPEIEPLDFYQGTWFDKEEARPSAVDVETGELGR